MDECCSTHLIEGDGTFNEAGLDNFVKTVNLSERGLNYAVVSIMGPQSSGKSTLLNHLFHTNFREMDAFKGRTQTTQGIWLARATGIDPCTLVMDLEGSDGRERGEDDTTFEKQSALFALAVSDIVLINMWCHDIGREQAANKPLLKTVFQVMMRLFSPRKTTLMFVIRDKTKTPLEVLEPILREDIQKIWDNIPKPPKHKDTPIGEFFNVMVTALPSYELKEEEFKEQVQKLRDRFVNSIAPGGLAGDRRGAVPASAFPFSTKEIWNIIRENKDLDLPAHKVMVATVRCEEIANEKLALLKSDKEWIELEEDVQTGPVKSFGKRLSAILDKYFSEYEIEAAYFDEGVRTSKLEQLKLKSLDLVFPAYQSMLGHIRSKALNLFKVDLERALGNGEGFAVSVRNCTQAALAAFDVESKDATVKQSTWDASKTREKLRRDIDSYAGSVLEESLSQIKEQFEKRLQDKLSEPVASLLDAGSPDTWPSIRKLYRSETDASVLEFKSALSGFEIDKEREEQMIKDLRAYAKDVIEKKAKEEAGQVLIRMKERFSSIFSQDAEGMPRVWTGKEDIKAITKEARSRSLKLLAVMSALRLDEKEDKVENILSANLLEGADVPKQSQDRSISTAVSPLASSTWEEIPPPETLITPVQCKSIWRQFKTETEYMVGQAIAAQEARKRSNSYLPPPWAIAALLVLGFNEFMLLLRNPLYLGVLFVLFLLGKALWIQLDVPGVFQHGAISGILQISTKFLPTVMGMLKRLADEGARATTPANGGQTNGMVQAQPLPESSSQGSSPGSGLTYSTS